MDESTFIFLSYHKNYGTPGRSYWVRDGCSANVSVKNCLCPSFELLYTMQCGCMNCCFVVKAPANAIMQRKQRQLGQKPFLHVLPNRFWEIWSQTRVFICFTHTEHKYILCRVQIFKTILWNNNLNCIIITCHLMPRSHLHVKARPVRAT